MNWCILRQLLTRHYSKCLLPKLCRGQTYISHTSVQCNLCSSAKSYKILTRIYNVEQTRYFTTTKLCGATPKTMPTFNDFYSAVEEANKSIDDLKIYKYLSLSDNPTERDMQIKRWMFVEAVDLYVEKTATPQAAGLRRGHMEFITTALERMKELGVARDIECYKAVIKVGLI